MDIDLKSLYELVPDFECKEGCHDCCGPTAFGQIEWDQLEEKRESDELMCPYLGPEGCEIYEQRPMSCRVFGTYPEAACPHGCGPAVPMNQVQGAWLQKVVLDEKPPHLTGARFFAEIELRLDAERRAGRTDR